MKRIILSTLAVLALGACGAPVEETSNLNRANHKRESQPSSKDGMVESISKDAIAMCQSGKLIKGTIGCAGSAVGEVTLATTYEVDEIRTAVKSAMRGLNSSYGSIKNGDLAKAGYVIVTLPVKAGRGVLALAYNTADIATVAIVNLVDTPFQAVVNALNKAANTKFAKNHKFFVRSPILFVSKGFHLGQEVIEYVGNGVRGTINFAGVVTAKAVNFTIYMIKGAFTSSKAIAKLVMHVTFQAADSIYDFGKKVIKETFRAGKNVFKFTFKMTKIAGKFASKMLKDILWTEGCSTVYDVNTGEFVKKCK